MFVGEFPRWLALISLEYSYHKFNCVGEISLERSDFVSKHRVIQLQAESDVVSLRYLSLWSVGPTAERDYIHILITWIMYVLIRIHGGSTATAYHDHVTWRVAFSCTRYVSLMLLHWNYAPWNFNVASSLVCHTPVCADCMHELYYVTNFFDKNEWMRKCTQMTAQNQN